MTKVNIKKRIKLFDDRIKQALIYKNRDEPAKIRSFLIQQSPVVKLDTCKFYELYISKYPKNRVKKSIEYFLDIKIELFFILEVDIGLYNPIYHNTKNNKVEDNDYYLLRHLSFDQTLIIKSKILWERLMNFIYYMETGNDLDKKISKKKSKRKIFWKFVKNNKKWIFLLDYKYCLDQFDEHLRGPEVHKNSTLRKCFTKKLLKEPDILLLPVNIATNIWENIFNISEGKEANQKYWNIGMKKMKNKYRRNNKFSKS